MRKMTQIFIIKQWSLVLIFIWTIRSRDTWHVNFEGCEGITSISLLMLRKWITDKLTQNQSFLHHQVGRPHFLEFPALSVLSTVPTLRVVNVKLKRCIQFTPVKSLFAGCSWCSLEVLPENTLRWVLMAVKVCGHCPQIPIILERMLYKQKTTFNDFCFWFGWF